MANTNFEISVENYISDEYSICREERQYALFLYNILRKYKTQDMRIKCDKIAGIFDVCKIPPDAEIKEVFYEATFMRDFFERNRRLILGHYNPEKLLQPTFSPSNYIFSEKDKEKSFNKKLIEYIKNAKTDISNSCPKEDFDLTDGEYNLCGNKNTYGDIAREMMNAKPDIGVIYEDCREKYLLFLECKFESGEGSYKNDDGEVKLQRQIQYLIADFLCNHYLDTDNESLKLHCSPEMENEKSCIVNFTRKEEKGKILITDLIEINKWIFGEKYQNE